MLIGNAVDQYDPVLIELRVIEAINLVDIDEHLFTIKVKNDPMYPDWIKETVERMHNSDKLKAYWRKHWDIKLDEEDEDADKLKSRI